MTRGPAASLMSADGAQRFLRRGQRETLVLGLLIGTLWLVGAALSLLPPASKAGSVLLGSAAVATYFLWFPIAWWAIRGTRLRRAGRASWRPGRAQEAIPSPVDVVIGERVDALPRPPHDLIETMRARLADWLPPGDQGVVLTGQTSVAFVYHGAGRVALSPCGIFRLDGAIVGYVEGCDILDPSGERFASWRPRRERPWRTYRRRRFCLLTTGDEVIAIGSLHRPSWWRTERIAFIVLSEVVLSSQRWAAILDSCQALGLPVPESGGD